MKLNLTLKLSIERLLKSIGEILSPYTLKRRQLKLSFTLLISIIWLFPVAAQSVTAYWINSSDSLFSGGYADGEISDLMIANDRVAFIIGAIDHPGYYTASGGNILDAASSIDRVDEFGELYTYFNDDWPRQAVYNTIMIMNDGADGNPAVIRASGVDSDNSSILVVTNYSLAASDDFLSITTTLTNSGTGTITDFELGSGIYWGDCLKWAPGYGFSLTGITHMPWLAGTSEQLSYGYLSPDTAMMWGDHGGDWSDINVGIATLNPNNSCTYTCYLIVGGKDIASVATLAHMINEIPVGSLTCSVTDQLNGDPVADVKIEVSDSLNLPYLQMVTDLNGQALCTLPPGIWSLETSASGYSTMEISLSISLDSTVNYDFVLVEDNTIPATGDTLTVIQRPILNIPAIVLPGDTLMIECEADMYTTHRAAELLYGSSQITMDIYSEVYNPATLWWNIAAGVPNVPIFELYDLKVTASGGISDTTVNAVHVIPEFKNDYYFVHITDTHLPTNMYYYEYGSDIDSSSIIDFREVIRDINIINPEFVLLTGDLVNEGELEDFQNRRYFTKAQRMLTELDVPVYLVSGNHDLGGWNDTPPPDGTARRTWWKFFGWKRLNDPPVGALWYTQNYSFDYGPVHYIGMEAYLNYDNWRWGIYGYESFTAGQMQWLTDELTAASGSSARVLFYHFDFSDQIFLNQLGVEMALYGHTHQNGGSILSPPYNLCTASTCSGRRAYRLVRVSNGVLHPSSTVYSGSTGNNLQVEFQPANDGSNFSVTAEITNWLFESFEHAQLRFFMPDTTGQVTVTGGTLLQVDNSDSLAVYYIGVDIQPSSTQIVTVSLTQVHTEDEFSAPNSYKLHQNWPNPFNPLTTIRYDIPELSSITITIYDLLGRQVRTLLDQVEEPGYKSIQWDATNDQGQPVSAGIYLYRINVGSFTQTKKMVLLR